jgi:hypothetical protein
MSNSKRAKFTKEDLERMRSVGHMRGGRTRDKVRTITLEGGERAKETTDQLGNIVTEHGDRQDVHITTPELKFKAPQIM